MRFSCNDIARYYDKNQIYYSHCWSATALHYGLWYQSTRNLAEAIANTNRLLVDALSIDSTDVVLDAGCGVGGTSVHIAETTGARVSGITLSSVQLKLGSKMAARSPAAQRLSFSLQDYSCTMFPDATFSKLVAVESVCHANEKGDFLREAFRILKPGGRLAVVDAFLTKVDLTADEQCLYRRALDGWAVPNLSSPSQFQNLLEGAGFEHAAFEDMTRHIEKSARRIWRNSWLTWPINLAKATLGVARENVAARYQFALFKRRLAIYGILVAQKPTHCKTNMPTGDRPAKMHSQDGRLDQMRLDGATQTPEES